MVFMFFLFSKGFFMVQSTKLVRKKIATLKELGS